MSDEPERAVVVINRILAARIETLEAALRATLTELSACSTQLKAHPDGSVGRAILMARAALAPEREYDPNVALCDDAEFGMKP